VNRKNLLLEKEDIGDENLYNDENEKPVDEFYDKEHKKQKHLSSVSPNKSNLYNSPPSRNSSSSVTPNIGSPSIQYYFFFFFFI
jgi:hypothetical protein